MPTDDRGPPVGERVSALERGDAETRRNMDRIEARLDEVLDRLGLIQSRIDERRGATRVGTWALGFVQVLTGGTMAWSLSRLFHGQP